MIVYVVIFLIILVFALPALVALGFFSVVALSFGHLGISPTSAILVLLAMFVGSFLNIPLGRARVVIVEEPGFLGLFRKRARRLQGISLNVGGGLIPLMLVGILLPGLPLGSTAFATGIVALSAFLFSKHIPLRGIVLPMGLTALVTVVAALLIASNHAPAVAFVAGVTGVLIGADLMRLPDVMRREQGMLSIGGAGVFDGIFLIGIISALLAGL
ncbi:MAG: DUF1614 domain-containing protein [bacterium]|nr:DUF1614 domain-containing protein [bacterium]